MANIYSGLTSRGSDIWKSWTWGGQAFSPTPPLITSHIEGQVYQVRCFQWCVWPLQCSLPQVSQSRSTARPSFLVFQEVKLGADKPRLNKRVFLWSKASWECGQTAETPSAQAPSPCMTWSLKLNQPLSQQADSPPSLPPLQLPTLFFFNMILFIWLCWVLVMAHRIFSCGMWDLVPWPGMESEPPCPGNTES